jgi:putative holliday junction resolvase
MEILAIDYGDKRLGLAVANELGFVKPLLTLARIPKATSLAQIKALVDERGIEQIVVGLPLRLDGTLGDAAARVQRFVAELSGQVACPVVTWNESLTSYEAETRMREMGIKPAERKARVDQFAALVMLEDYLAANPHKAISENY